MSDATVAVDEVSGDPRDALISEKRTMPALEEVLTLYGYDFYRVGQNDARRTQDEGVSDYIAFHALDGVLFLEAKRPRRRKDRKDRQSAAQKRFEKHAAGAGAHYILTSDAVVLADRLESIRALRRAREK